MARTNGVQSARAKAAKAPAKVGKPVSAAGAHAGGRPSKYNPEFHPMLAEAWGRYGLTDAQLADKLGVTVATVFNWKNAHPEFLEALKTAKTEPDEHVERSLYERANGYSFDSEKIVTVSDGQSMGSHVERVPIVEHCPPDVTACIFWLKNRRPDRWRDRQEITGADGGPLEVVSMSPAERALRLSVILAKAAAE